MNTTFGCCSDAIVSSLEKERFHLEISFSLGNVRLAIATNAHLLVALLAFAHARPRLLIVRVGVLVLHLRRGVLHRERVDVVRNFTATSDPRHSARCTSLNAPPPRRFTSSSSALGITCNFVAEASAFAAFAFAFAPPAPPAPSSSPPRAAPSGPNRRRG